MLVLKRDPQDFNIMMKPYTYYIGIDAGTKTGWCVWNKSEKFIRQLETMPIHRAMKEMELWKVFAPGNIFVRLEDARLRKWIPKQKTESAERGRREGAGYVKAHCAIWEAFLTDLGIPFELVAPKNNKTKVKADYFKKLTGYKGQTNNHERDAGMLVVGY
jgi:hypothetical protein